MLASYSEDEFAILKQCRKGSREAFGLVVKRYMKPDIYIMGEVDKDGNEKYYADEMDKNVQKIWSKMSGYTSLMYTIFMYTTFM